MGEISYFEGGSEEAAMAQFEYKVVPAPLRAEKVRGAKTTVDRFAVTLTTMMNDLGREGWEYLRADTLPCEERVGFTGKQTTFMNMLVFRKVIGAAAVMDAPIGAFAAPVFMASAGVEAPLPAPPPAPRVDWPMNGAAPAVGPARPLAAE
jgi:hypothetical protein